MPKVSPYIYRKYDIRGTAVGDSPDLIPQITEWLGMAYATLMKRKYGTTTIAVGGDNRSTTPALKSALCRGAQKCGAEVIDIGEVLTPTVYFAASRAGEHGGGVMITGSHLTPEYNGVKMSNGALTLTPEEIQELRVMVEDEDFDRGEGSYREDPGFIETYQEELKGTVQLEKPIKVVLDAGNSLAGRYAPPVIQAVGANLIACLYCQPDPAFPNHLPNPQTPELMEDLQTAVKALGADLGIAYDGDADRAGVVDNEGNFVPADYVLALLAQDLLKRHPGEKILHDVKTSLGAIETIRDAGGEPLMWRTGHSIMKQKMHDEGGMLLGGELSGHIFMGEDWPGFDDGVMVSLRVIDIVAKSGKTAAELFGAMPHYHATPEFIMHTPDEVKFDVVGAITAHFASDYDVVTLDGVRVNFPEGWGLVRASNTHPAITVRVEAKSPEALKKYMGLIGEQLEKYPAVEADEFKEALARM